MTCGKIKHKLLSPRLTSLGVLNLRAQMSFKEMLEEDERKASEKVRAAQAATRIASAIAGGGGAGGGAGGGGGGGGAAASAPKPSTAGAGPSGPSGPSGAAAAGGGDDSDSDVEVAGTQTNLWDKKELDRVLGQVAVRPLSDPHRIHATGCL